ncbi:hypothetical protein MTHERMMSTA1_05670 [Methanosarcina thermophila MST-A1]|jgi:hypothetical protein|uniref:Uncharacterized protein n=1 Tax=Methanosarcina thermophila TaxID=2210 RepID=A0A3G9CZS5_METTE|nr:hypothetical protein [Methanosarcina thermophila]NLU56839.1 hypothetical protein [Methanosarcina thermophila]BAW30559.1 conserved hypothetical protein [Methanosarcina thermophila]GLI13441.1 hypothetical protein MTHERMMSTA1_05670 [Methanosarcina thermophila MST-A1]HOA68267.1 hypothetical protein [Methanosarcina thermophila]HOQ65024.1 hypothetical protein [Methanosarcina thermophila]
MKIKREFYDMDALESFINNFFKKCNKLRNNNYQDENKEKPEKLPGLFDQPL